MTPPRAAARPVAREVGGVRYDDPYAWLEEDSDAALAWQEAQSAWADAQLGPDTAAAAARIAACTPLGELQPPRRFGRRWFQERRHPGAQRTVVEVLDELGDIPHVLLDPGELHEDPTTTIMGWQPSPDGSKVVYCLQVGGAEVGQLRVLDVATRRNTPDHPTALVRIPAIAWFADGSGFLFTGMHHDRERFALTLFRHELGAEPVTAPEDLPANEQPLLVPQVSDDGRYAAAIGDPLGYRPLYLLDCTAPDRGWRPFLLDVPVAATGAFAGDEYVAVTTLGAPRGRVVAIPVATAADPASWRELVGESDAVLTGVTSGVQVDGDRLVLSELVDVAPRVRILERSGLERAVVPLPGPGAVVAAAHDGELTLSFSSSTQSAGVYRYRDGGNGEVEELSRPEHVHADLVLELHHTTGPDGTPLSYHVLQRRDLAGTGPRPALVHAYGGWNVPLVAAYAPEQVVVAQAGAVIVRPHVRGGGEYGHAWWDAGRLHEKRATFRDLFAIVERVVADGLVDAERIAFEGASNGGMLAGAVLTQRPELFRAVAGVVPVLDLLQLRRDPITVSAARSDYGDPDDAAFAPLLHAYSPYHQVDPSRTYPTSLWVCGRNDPRCPAWHGRKMVAALQGSRGDGPHLLSVPEDVGHGSALRDHLTAMHARWVAFVLRALGLAVAG